MKFSEMLSSKYEMFQKGDISKNEMFQKRQVEIWNVSETRRWKYEMFQKRQVEIWNVSEMCHLKIYEMFQKHDVENMKCFKNVKLRHDVSEMTFQKMKHFRNVTF